MCYCDGLGVKRLAAGCGGCYREGCTGQLAGTLSGVGPGCGRPGPRALAPGGLDVPQVFEGITIPRKRAAAGSPRCAAYLATCRAARRLDAAEDALAGPTIPPRIAGPRDHGQGARPAAPSS